MMTVTQTVPSLQALDEAVRGHPLAHRLMSDKDAQRHLREAASSGRHAYARISKRSGVRDALIRDRALRRELVSAVAATGEAAAALAASPRKRRRRRAFVVLAVLGTAGAALTRASSG